ncbi:MAG: hypothetical protein GY868_16870 [Deltaproteobacteria bacterium]|nr:hypothetical protein [Deltaproteobacteria bacterium]
MWSGEWYSYMRLQKYISAIVLQMLISSVWAGPALAVFELYDGKLQLSGFVKNTSYIRTQFNDRAWHKSSPGSSHDSHLDFSNTSFLLEALYTLRDDDVTVRLFGGFKYWYEASPRIDDNLRRHIPNRFRKDYIKPRELEDVLSELYLDVISGPWEVRIGKQIVIWGQLDTNRVADVVNPLDLRWGVPGIDSWEEVKRGLWIIRTFYQSGLPGELRFEFIFNPGDYKMTQLPYTGTHWGPDYYTDVAFVPGREMGIWSYQDEKWRRDEPSWNLTENYEFGFRVSGYAYGVDWTLLYWNAPSDGPVIHADRLNAMVTQGYIRPGIRAAITGSSLVPGEWPSHRIFYFKRMQTIGGTAQTYIDWLHRSTWDLEWFYEIGSPMNLAERGQATAVYDWTRKDVFGAAVKYNDRFVLPRTVRDFLQTNKKLDLTCTYFWEKVFSHSHDLVLRDRLHRPGDSVTDGVSLWWKLEAFNSAWALTFIGNYYFRIGAWMAVPMATYYFPEPLGGLRAEIGYKAYGRKRSTSQFTSFDHKDSIILRFRYEF